MNRNKVYLGFLVAGIVAIIVYMAYGMVNVGREETYYSVSVIVENSSDARWSAFKEGLEQGAEDNHLYLNVVFTGELTDLEEQIQLIDREAESGADGVIIQLCDSEDPEGLLDEAAAKTPLVLAGTGTSQSGQFLTIGGDYYEEGRALANALADGEQISVKELKIGVLGGNQKQLSQQERLRGLQERLEELGGTITWMLTEEEVGGDVSVLADMRIRSPVDVLVTLENEETELAVDCRVKYSKSSWRIYGVGRSEKAVYYLDRGEIRALLVPDEYFMGYQCTSALAQMLKYHTGTAELDKNVRYLCVTEKNLYDKENERILFPVIR